MSCALLDLACHAQSAAWEWWAGVGFLNKALIVLGIMAVIVGLSWSVLSVLRRVGGWPAVIGALAVIGGLVLAILPRKPKSDDYPTDLPVKDAARPFRVPKRKGAAKQGAPWDNWSKS